MSRQGFNLKPVKVRVPAGEEVQLNVSGIRLFCEDANQSFEIRTENGDRSPMKPGRSIGLGENTRLVRVINENNSELYAVLSHGYGDIKDNSVTGEVTVKNARSLNPMAPVTLSDNQKFTIPANSARQKLTLYADSANTGTVWLAGAKNQGLPLLGGHAHDITEFSGTVQLCGDGAGSQTVYLMEVND